MNCRVGTGVPPVGRERAPAASSLPSSPFTPTVLPEHTVQASTVDLVTRYSECLFKYLSPRN